ncbi:MAG: DnaJ domain-containing protein [Planctomycetia bacterium]|nr:DnaJ domain-containing protein [Planctomycetia bacterium]
MSPLPDRLADWPTDPYQLLGVPHGADLSTVRRAYNKLIRIYRPDHAPDEFRRVRDAYEWLLEAIRRDEWYRKATGGVAASDAEESDDSDIESAADVDANSPTMRVDSAPAEDELDAAWRMATTDDVAVAYRRISDLHGRFPSQSALCLRLYWLLRIDPACDARRVPVDWLATALRLTGLAGPALELYRRELRLDPNEALAQRCANLLDRQGPAARLCDLAEARWRAAGSIGRHDVILADLARLHEPVHGESEELWFRLLVSACNQLAWSSDLAIRREFAVRSREIEEMTHLHNTLRAQFDRMDTLRELAAAWRSSDFDRTFGSWSLDENRVPSSWWQMIKLSWTTSFEELRADLLPVLAQIARQPAEALKVFGLLRERNSVAANCFAQVLLDFAGRQETPGDDSVRTPAARQEAENWLWTVNAASYSLVRVGLLSFCVGSGIRPQAVAEVAEEVPMFFLKNNESFAHKVQEDAPLRAVYAVAMGF